MIVNENAIKKAKKLADNKNNIKLCLQEHICPSCASTTGLEWSSKDFTERQKVLFFEVDEPYTRQGYRCKECGWNNLKVVSARGDW